MSLGDTLCQLAEQQNSLAGQGPTVQHSNMIDELQGRSADLAAAVSEAESQLEENQGLKQESQAFKGATCLDILFHRLCYVRNTSITTDRSCQIAFLDWADFLTSSA